MILLNAFYNTKKFLLELFTKSSSPKALNEYVSFDTKTVKTLGISIDKGTIII
jgi:hypothetical protein